jgi:hypothetical protein
VEMSPAISLFYSFAIFTLTPNDAQKAREAVESDETIESKSLKSTVDKDITCQLCVTGTKNLVAEQQKSEVLRRNQTGEVKGKIIEYAWWLKKDGKSDSTILGRTKILSVLTKRGANLYDPESIKEAIANQPWSSGRKNNSKEKHHHRFHCTHFRRGKNG